MKKIYYSLAFTLTSPLRIGNGQHEESDSDLMLDGRGLPFIPGTSLAGIFRHRAVSMGMSSEDEKRLFGIVLPQTKGDPIIEKSAILFGDAALDKETNKDEIVFGRRDGVGLGEWGTAKRTSKFDFQMAETKGTFYSVIEWTGDEEQYKAEIQGIIDPILEGFIAEGISVGARTSRGYGQFNLCVRKRMFSFPEDLDTWINDFNPYDRKSFETAEVMVGKAGAADTKVEISFNIVSPFSVRVSTARTELAEDGSVPDSVPMENFKGNPVIPGTAWAGAFRHHMHDLLRDTGLAEESPEMYELDALFGIGAGSGSTGKSKLCFSETEIAVKDKSVQKSSVMRTAIDRFTASPRTSALFTSMVYFGGNGTLTISFKQNEVSEKYLELLAADICDLHLGLISLGGEAAVGRGIMQVERVTCNAVDKTEQMKNSIHGAPLNWLKGDDTNA